MTDFVAPYLDPDRGILRNLVGVQTQSELGTAEAELSWARLADLPSARIEPTGDLAELRTIHRYLF